MKLDRYINPDRRGKYALIKLRQLRNFQTNKEVQNAIWLLNRAGLIHWGDEGAGEQFFVMKYKDKFTPFGLRAYQEEVSKSTDPELKEYATELYKEWILACKENEGRIPD